MNPEPISSNERIVSIDIIRGIALLGILLVNMPALFKPGLIIDMYGLERKNMVKY